MGRVVDEDIYVAELVYGFLDELLALRLIGHVSRHPDGLAARIFHSLRRLLGVRVFLFQGAVYGFPVSGFGSFGPTLLATEQGGPELWTGGSFGPEGGLLVPAVMLLGMSLVALWTRLRTGKISLHTPIAESPSSDSQHIPPQRHSA